MSEQLLVPGAMCNKNQFSVYVVIKCFCGLLLLPVVNSVWEGTYLSGESILMYSKLRRSKVALKPFRRLTTMWHVYTNIIMLLIQVHRDALNTFNSYSVERTLSIICISIFVLGYYMYRLVFAHAHRNGQLL